LLRQDERALRVVSDLDKLSRAAAGYLRSRERTFVISEFLITRGFALRMDYL
jgi:hypothetical protein